MFMCGFTCRKPVREIFGLALIAELLTLSRRVCGVCGSHGHDHWHLRRCTFVAGSRGGIDPINQPVSRPEQKAKHGVAAGDLGICWLGYLGYWHLACGSYHGPDSC